MTYTIPVGILDPTDYFGSVAPINDPASGVNGDISAFFVHNWPFVKQINCYYVDKLKMKRGQRDD